MVDTAQLALELGATDNEAFQQQVDAAVGELERLLGYPLCGTTEAEERIFTFRAGHLWQKVHPMYGEPEAIVVVDTTGAEETIVDYQLGQNGRLFGDWFNAIKLCKNAGHLSRCTCYEGRCDYIKVTATWGFGARHWGSESPGEGEAPYCYLPPDLYNLLVQAVKASINPKTDIQSENTGTRSYSKFAASYQTVWQKYSGIIEFYRLREPRL